MYQNAGRFSWFYGVCGRFFVMYNYIENKSNPSALVLSINDLGGNTGNVQKTFLDRLLSSQGGSF
jgi:hypothetical protein